MRIYDRALTAAEVTYVATKGSGYMPLLARTNLPDTEAQGQKAINFRDYALFMTKRLEKKI